MQPITEKLNFENYLNWALDMKFLLDDDIWELVLNSKGQLVMDATEEVHKAYK